MVTKPPTLPVEDFLKARTILRQAPEFASHADLIELLKLSTEFAGLRFSLPETNKVDSRILSTWNFMLSTVYIGTGSLLPGFLELVRQNNDPDGTSQQLWILELGELIAKVRTELALQAAADPPTTLNGKPVNVSAVLQGAGAGANPPQLIANLQMMLKRAASVARVRISVTQGATLVKPVDSGSAWLIAPGLVMTCWHVLAATDNMAANVPDPILRDHAAASSFTFEYSEPGKGHEFGTSAPDDLLCYSQDLDYALLRLQDKDHDGRLAGYSYLPIDTDPTLRPSVQVAVIQYPGGSVESYSPGTYVGVEKLPPKFQQEDARRFWHAAGTAGGSSGSPIFRTSDWHVVGIHRAGTAVGAFTLGIATRLQPIMDHLQANAGKAFEEIMAAQDALQK